jgi:hypothetical protein
MKIGVNLDGVKIELEVGSTDTIRSVIKKALSTVFPTETSPPAEGCVASLCGESIGHHSRVEELLELEEGHLLVVSLPF